MGKGASFEGGDGVGDGVGGGFVLSVTVFERDEDDVVGCGDAGGGVGE